MKMFQQVVFSTDGGKELLKNRADGTWYVCISYADEAELNELVTAIGKAIAYSAAAGKAAAKAATDAAKS